MHETMTWMKRVQLQCCTDGSVMLRCMDLAVLRCRDPVQRRWAPSRRWTWCRWWWRWWSTWTCRGTTSSPSPSGISATPPSRAFVSRPATATATDHRRLSTWELRPLIWNRWPFPSRSIARRYLLRHVHGLGRLLLCVHEGKHAVLTHTNHVIAMSRPPGIIS